MVCGVKGSREIKETETVKFLWTNSSDQVVVDVAYNRDVSEE